MRSPSPRSPSPNSCLTQDALLHGQFTGWSMGGNSGGSSGGSSSSADSGPSSPAGSASLPSSPSSCTYSLTLTLTHIHVQRIWKPGKESQVIMPLSELAGCNCPRAPAPPLLVLYWYPVGRRRRGVAKRRQVRAYLAESRVEAEKWNTAVQCLLRGIDISIYTEFSKSLLPRPRRLLLLVNPFSGRGLAMQWCQTHILPMISEANISYNLIQTERQNHARELIREISLHEWDGIVIVSGDGLLHEVINGLMERPDWEQAIKTPVGILPCGSGNALAGSINHYAGYDMCLREPLLINCCFLLCRGGVRPMDLVSVTTSPSTSSNQNGRPPSPKRLFSFLSVAWGFVSDVDIESERYRGLGSARFTLGTLVRLASLRSYKGRLSYLPPGGANLTPEVSSQTPHRPLSRSITEGLEGYCRMPIHRTCSDMGLSEQRSLQKGDREREREERDRERRRRRGRARGGGVVRASSLAEDREREMEVEERMEGTSGSSAQSNGRLESNEEEEEDDCAGNTTEEGIDDVDEGKEVEERMEGTSGSSVESSERQESERNEKISTNEEGEDGKWNGTDGTRDVREEYSADEGRKEEEEEEAYSNPDQQKMLRKNSAPSSQIATAFFSRPIGADSEHEVETQAYEREDADLEGTFFHCGAFPADPARERALTISSPFRRSRFSLSKPKTSADQNKNQKPSVSKPRPLSLLQQSSSNSLPPKFPSLSLSLSPTPPSSPSNSGPHTCLPSSTSSSAFSFELVHPGRLKTRPPVISPVDPPPQDNLLPPLDQPLPTRDWVTIEGDFVLVLAIYQSHLGADLFAAPHAQFDDGLIHLTFVRAGISRATLLRLFLAMERGTHLSLSSPYVSHVSARAFRLQPLSPRGTLTVDGELVPYGPLQAQIHPSMARVIVGDSGVKITRF